MRRPSVRSIQNAARSLAAVDAGDLGERVRAMLADAAALRHETPAVSRNDPLGMIERLLTRRANRSADRAELAAASVFPRLSQFEQAEVLRRIAPRQHSIVVSLITAERSAERLAGLAILAAQPDWALIPHAAGLIGTASEDETSAAIDAISAVIYELVDKPCTQPAAFERAIAAVLDAASRHRVRPGTSETPERRSLGVALMLLSPAVRAGCFGRGPRGWLSDAPQALEFALRASLRKLDGKLGVMRALELIAQPGLRAAAVERVADAKTPDEFVALVTRAHLGRRPLRRSALRSRIDHACKARLGEALRELDCMHAGNSKPPPPIARGVSDWASLLGIPVQSRNTLLEPLLANPDPAARFAAVLVTGDELRLDQALDEKEPVALTAALRIALPEHGNTMRGQVDPHARRLLRRSQHASVRKLAACIPIRGDTHPLSIVSLRIEFQRDPSSVLEHLAERIRASDTGAIELADRLECADELLDALENALHSGEPDLVAAAVRALASARAPRADELLRSTLQHDTPRVRANTVEAMAIRARRWKESPLMLRLDDPHHRPASTSIRAQLIANTPDEHTPDRVRDLLASSEPLRRAAGLWVTERSAAELKPVVGRRWAEIAARVADSARNGETLAERRRATRCARRMLAVTLP